MGNCVSIRGRIVQVTVAAEDSDFDSSTSTEEDDIDSRNSELVLVLHFFPLAGSSPDQTTGGANPISHQNRNCVIEVRDGANTHTLFISGLSPSPTHVTPRTSTRSAIALDDDDPPQQQHSSSQLLMSPPHNDDISTSGGLRTSPMMEPRPPSDPYSPRSMASLQTSGLLRQSVTETVQSTSSAGGGGTATSATTVTVMTVSDPKMWLSGNTNWDASGQEALLERLCNETWVEAAAAELGLRHRKCTTIILHSVNLNAPLFSPPALFYCSISICFQRIIRTKQQKHL